MERGQQPEGESLPGVSGQAGRCELIELPDLGGAGRPLCVTCVCKGGREGQGESCSLKGLALRDLGTARSPGPGTLASQPRRKDGGTAGD